MATETDIKVEPSESAPGQWYWAFLVGGKTYRDGDALTQKEAEQKARDAREEWEYRQS